MQLALDAWNELEPELQKPLLLWLSERDGRMKTTALPDGNVRLPAEGDFFDATTVYFGKKRVKSLVCASRGEVEFVAAMSREGAPGAVLIPASEAGCKRLRGDLKSRLREGRERIRQLAEQRAGTDKLREHGVQLLDCWFISGRGG